MFEAFIIVCAVSANMKIDDSNCLALQDDWGPYITNENCNIRTDQMIDETLNGEMNYYISALLGYPPFLYAKGYCTNPKNSPI